MFSSTWHRVLHGISISIGIACIGFATLVVHDVVTHRRGNAEHTTQDLRLFAISLRAFVSDGGKIPDGGLGAVIAAMERRSNARLDTRDPYGLQRCQLVHKGIDPWGNPFIFVYSNQKSTATIRSAGQNQVDENGGGDDVQKVVELTDFQR